MLSITITCVQFLINYQKFFFYIYIYVMCVFLKDEKRYHEMARLDQFAVSYRIAMSFSNLRVLGKILNATYRYNFKCIFHCYYFNVITCKDSSSLWRREQFLTFFFIRFIRITRVYFEQVMKKIWRQFRDKLYDDSFKIMMILAKFIYLLHEFSD